MDASDRELLSEFCRGSQEAFTALVRRHVDLVYAVALRSTRDPAAAEDVTQAAFLVLARKAEALSARPTVAGWLLVTTRNLAATAVRARARRRRHEQAAATMETVVDPDSIEIAESEHLFDNAMDRLAAAERDAIALRFYESRSFAEVGRLMGTSEEAARKRVNRGLGRLRVLLSRRGVALSAAGLATLATAMAAAPAPASTLAVATATSGGTTAGSAAALAKGFIHMQTFKHTAAAIGAVFLGLSTVVCVTVIAQAPPLTPAAAKPAAPPAVWTPGEFYIGGNVDWPGAYPIGRGVTLSQALGFANVRPADGQSVRIVHQNATGETFETLSLADVMSGPEGNRAMNVDDQINVTILPQPIDPKLASMAMLLHVRDVSANVVFLSKLGFLTIWEESPQTAGGQILRASVRSGVVSIRLDQTDKPNPNDGITTFFWIDGGTKAFEAYRNGLIAQGVPAGPIGPDINMQKFAVTTPDGYALNFYAARD